MAAASWRMAATRCVSLLVYLCHKHSDLSQHGCERAVNIGVGAPGVARRGG